MDEFSEGYEEEEYEVLPEGIYQVKIVTVVHGTSKKSGLPMLIIEIIPMKKTVVSGTEEPEEIPVTLKYYIVKNEYYNKNITKFFDCFKIRRNDFDYMAWCGKTGKAFIGMTEQNTLFGRKFHEIKYLIVDNEKAENDVNYQENDDGE
jgi:hypothetical protein